MSKSRRWVAVLAVLAMLERAPADAQTAADAAARVDGVVRDARDGRPLREVRVEGVGEAGPRGTFSDHEGRFTLSGPLRPVRFSKAGYASRVVGRGQLAASGFVVDLAPGGAITGRVVSASGAPMSGVAIGVRRIEGPPDTGAAERSLTDTDDRGEYRVGGLGEGTYVVERLAAPGLDRTSSMGALLGQIQAGRVPVSAHRVAEVRVGAGEEIRAADIVSEDSPSQAECTGQSAPRQTAGLHDSFTVRGRVVTTSGRPVPCAAVRLGRAGAPARVGRADAAGGFAFAGVGPGVYTIEVSHPGHVPVRYRQETASSPGESITVPRDGTRDPIIVRLPKGGAIDGVVVSEHGEPLAGIAVRALLRHRVGDVVVAGTAPNVTERTTDDRGRFRLFGLLPGTYYIRAATSLGSGSTPGAAPGYPVTYYPGTTRIESASAVEIGAETSVSPLTIVVASARTFNIAGAARSSAGRAATAVMMFESQRSSRIMVEPRTAPVGGDGSFLFTDVPPGEYAIQALARSTGSGSPSLGAFEFAAAYVRVEDADPPPITLQTREGSVAEGRVVAERGGDVPPLRIDAVPADFDRSTVIGIGASGATSDEAGRFRITGLFGPRLFRLEHPPGAWYITSVTIQATNGARTPFDFGTGGTVHPDIEIRVANDVASVFGRVVTDRGDVVVDCPVLVFSVDSRDWYPNSVFVRQGRSDQNGFYRVDGLPPGEYWIVAPEGVGDWSDHDALGEILAGLQGGRRIALGPSQSLGLNLTRNGR
jgi:protocatechuate 3,4-dioxygenase beta subunit